MRTLIFYIFFIQLSLAGSSFGQEPDFTTGNEFYRAAMKFYQDKQYDSMQVYMKRALSFRPNHPTMLYNLAVSYALNNKEKVAYATLNKMINMGLFYEIDKDSDFAALRNRDEFKSINQNFIKNSMPVINSNVAFKYPEKDLITESVAYDPIDQIFYLSSIHKRKIVMINKNGKTADFKSEMEDGLWAVFGMKVDAKRRLLYVCTSPVEQMINFDPGEDDKGALIKYDLESGRLLNKYSFDNNVTKHLFGDLAIDKNGNVYLSDSKGNAVYRLSYNNDQVDEIIKPGKFISLQGLDLDDNDENLYLADYSLGLYRYNFETGDLIYIHPSETFVPQGLDGLYFYKSSLIAIQNGISPQRIVCVYLNDKKDEIIKWKTIEENDPLFDEITLGVVNRNDFYFIANGQWGSFNKDGSIFPMDKLKEPVVLHLKPGI